ncbi:MAG: hypothetical protein GY775_06215, partial [Candidatus Scalindua sp.]|nr:hypothetical protein [Candidatus Scalindua sp.]
GDGDDDDDDNDDDDDDDDQGCPHRGVGREGGLPPPTLRKRREYAQKLVKNLCRVGQKYLYL